MKHIVALDGDGHFMVSKLDDRKHVIEEVIMQISDGDHYANSDTIDDYMSLTEEEWLEYLETFVQRGMCEFVDIEA